MVSIQVFQFHSLVVSAVAFLPRLTAVIARRMAVVITTFGAH
jgi:hypothetical protein